MRIITAFLPMLICGGGMFLCMRMMSGGKSKGASCHEKPETVATAKEIAELHDEVSRLKAQLTLNQKTESH